VNATGVLGVAVDEELRHVLGLELLPRQFERNQQLNRLLWERES